MTGFMPELIHPSQVTTVTTRSGLWMQDWQNADSKLVTKKGNQHAMNTPITIPNVLYSFIHGWNFWIFEFKLRQMDLRINFYLLGRFPFFCDFCQFATQIHFSDRQSSRSTVAAHIHRRRNGKGGNRRFRGWMTTIDWLLLSFQSWRLGNVGDL